MNNNSMDSIVYLRATNY